MDHSSYTDVVSSAGGTVTPAGSAGGVTGDAGFVSPAGGDFSLAPGSPLIDRGDPALAALNELDLAGAPRSLDGDGDCAAAPDIGAFARPDVHARCGGGGGGGGGSGGGAGGGAASPAGGTGAQAAAPVADLIPADVAGFGLERRRFAVARGPTAVTAAKKKRRAAPRGTAFRYTISEPATARIAIDRAGAGLQSGRRCAKPTKALRRRRARRCTRYIRAGTLVRTAAQGANRHPFTGRIGRRALKPGPYRAMITTTDVAGNASRASTAFFRVVKG